MGDPHPSGLRLVLYLVNQTDTGTSKRRYAAGIDQDTIGHRDGKCRLDEQLLGAILAHVSVLPRIKTNLS